MADVSAMLGKLRPVTFRYKQAQDGGAHPLQYGLIAEEVAETFPDLAVFNTDGSAETVKYHLLPSFLLAGYQAQQNTIAAQERRSVDAAEQRSSIATLKSACAGSKRCCRRAGRPRCNNNVMKFRPGRCGTGRLARPDWRASWPAPTLAPQLHSGAST